jgi:hypothetical protein
VIDVGPVLKNINADSSKYRLSKHISLSFCLLLASLHAPSKECKIICLQVVFLIANMHITIDAHLLAASITFPSAQVVDIMIGGGGIAAARLTPVARPV